MDRIRGGLFGLLVGDALGVPYEFHLGKSLPPFEALEFLPPPDFPRTYPEVPPGTWSDDGAQALCLLESLLGRETLDLDDLGQKLLDWYQNGRWAVGQVVFDVGNQTAQALLAYEHGTPPEQSGNVVFDGKGNGSLMRVLPLALWHRGSDTALVMDAHRQSLVTHGHLCNQVCCALYCLTARRLLSGVEAADAIREALSRLRRIYRGYPAYQQELEWSIRPDEVWSGQGSGYVVDCLRSAFMCLESAASYEQAVKQAVALGKDTDTTACVTGGLAGIRFGLEAIPRRWLEALRDRALVEELAQRLLVWLEVSC